MKYTFYVLKKIFGIFIAAVLFFSLMLNLIDLLTNITNYLSRNAAVKDVLKVMIYYIPKTVWYAVPMAYLFAITFVVSDMYAHNEMIATFVSGISLRRFSIPIVVTGLVLSVGMIFFENYLVVPQFEKKTKLQNHLLEQEADANNSNVIVISDNARIIYFANRYREKTKRLENVYLVFRNDDKELESVISATNASWSNEKQVWELNNPVQYLKSGEVFEIVPVMSEYLERLTEDYTIFRHSTIDITTVDIQVAKEYINHLRKAGLPYNSELAEYYKKFAFPFIIFVTGLLALGLTGKAKKNQLLVGLTLAIIAIVVFYVFQSITMVMAKNGFIAPIMGALLPDIVFILIALVLLKYSKS